jgi:glutamate N-acetyltransferase/amino-acid N-acetyltransferase
MAVNLDPPTELKAVGGVTLATGSAGIKTDDRDDLVLICLAEGSVAVAVFTQSAFKAAPVQLAQQYLADSPTRALLINSGNANAATGMPGLEDAVACCRAAAQALDVNVASVLAFSTGVIGERLPVDAMLDCTRALAADLAPNAWLDAARAIMTTDTVPKAVSRSVELDGQVVAVTGIAKGSGMIRPDMATMLAFVATDAHVAPSCLDELIVRANRASFSRITVDGDTSTNDSFVLIATGASGMPAITSSDDPRFESLARAITAVAVELAQAIVRDGEGATKFVTITVQGGASGDECLEVAFTIAESPLVKTALFAGDPNWGRFCMAIGRARVAGLDPKVVSLWLDDVRVAVHGMLDPDYTDSAGAAIMSQSEFEVRIDLGQGSASETVWTTDLSYEYVRINAEYRT